MTYIHRKFSQVDKSLGIVRDFEEGQIEGMQTKLDILSSVVVVLIGLLEREGVLSEENSNILDRVKYNYWNLDGLETDDEGQI
jgi:hypothetical protein